MSRCEQCIIRKFNSLNQLTREELIRISACKTTKKVKKGEVLFNEGEHINGIFCVKSGVCKVSKLSDNGKQQTVRLIKKGNILGERSLVTEEASNLKATALNEMEVCFIPKQEILSDLKNNIDFTVSTLKEVAEKLKETDNFIVNMGQKTAKQRLAEVLLYLDKNFSEEDNPFISVALSREDIAELVGTATESIIRLLSQFNNANYIQLEKKKIAILDRQELEKIANDF